MREWRKTELEGDYSEYVRAMSQRKEAFDKS